jgi:large subunit ribosomal protein L21
MYAIVKTGGKQYRVERGQTLLVERLAAEQGSSVALEPILYRSDDTVFDTDGLKKVKVTAKIVAHERGEKLRVFKFKPKRGYKRRTGHRQELTRIEVTDISMGAAAKPAAAKPEAAEVATKPAATKSTPKAPPTPAAASRGGKGQEDPNGS